MAANAGGAAARGSSTLALTLWILGSLSYVSAKQDPIFKSMFAPLDSFDAFDWNITRHIGSKVPGNVLLSPVSLKLVLAMLYEGAGGKTSKELEEALGIDSSPTKESKYPKIYKSLMVSNEGYELDVGMKLFIDQEASAKKEFSEKISKKYNATIEKTDFNNTAKAVEQINNWAKSVTRGHIEHLVSEADTKSTTVLLLLNAVYFKGLWQYPFSPNNTVQGMFYPTPKTCEKVDYMVGDFILDYVDSPELNAEMVRLPYMGDRFALYIILPYNDTTIEKVMHSLSPTKTRSLINKMSPEAIMISLPKFQFEFASSLAPVLQQLGIKSIFSSDADLRNIAEGSKDLVVSNVIQKSVIQLNERGTVATAISAIDLVNKFGMQTPMPFNVSRPFGFFIEDEMHQTVVFVGKVDNPGDPGRGKVSASKAPAAAPADAPADLNAADPLAHKTPEASQSPTNSSDSVTVPTTTPAAPQQPQSPGSVGALPLANNPSADLSTFQYFDIELARGIGGGAGGNWVTSPVSVKSALGLLLEGAAGNTAGEICNALRLEPQPPLARQTMHSFQKRLLTPPSGPGVEVRIANAVLSGNNVPISDKYNSSAHDHFEADVKEYDISNPLQLSTDLNDWVSKKTNNYITEIIKPDAVKPSSKVIIVNVVFFKGEWKYGFNPSLTREALFHITPDMRKRVHMMAASGKFKMGRIGRLNAQIAELPYKDPRYSMVVLLPDERIGLTRLVSDLPYNPVLPILDNLREVDGDIILPKFSVSYNVDLIPVLKTIGVKELFSDNADLSDLVKLKTKVTNFIHMAKIDVSENGTVAAAASAATVQLLSAPDKRRFIVNRPFLFFIRDKESGFLFTGQVVNPSENQPQVPEKINEPQRLTRWPHFYSR